MLKTTGITRKIDELGRIVIPKEIRKNLGIRDGEALEIRTNGEEIILKKYYEVKRLEDLSNKLSDVINNIYDVDIIITDREKVLSSSIDKLVDYKLDNNLIDLIDNRKEFIGEDNIFDLNGYFTIVPIISSCDSLGLVIIFSDNLEDYSSLAKFISKILGDKIDI